MSSSVEKVLITGGDGFLGSHLARRYADNGVEVHVTAYPGNGKAAAGSGICVHELDLADWRSAGHDLPEGCDVAFHLAWQGVAPSARNDFSIQMGNVEMALSVMELFSELGIARVLFPGSTNEYLYCGCEVGPDALPCPSNAYGAAKVAARYLCAQFAVQNGIEFIYPVVTGIYSEDRRDSNVVFYTIDTLLNGEKPSLTKLEQLWDYVHVDDAVDAFIALGARGRDGGVYAIGHGDNWPLANYIRVIRDLIDPDAELGIGDVPYDREVLPSSCVNLSALVEDTGFVPQVDFETGISRVIEAIRAERENRTVG